MFEIVFLGTSASAPSIHRNLPSIVVKHEDVRFMIDCGEGTQRQILQSGIGFKKLNRILITHGHLDHILGLAGLLSTFIHWESIDKLEIFAGKNPLERIADLVYKVVLRGQEPPMYLNLIPIISGTLIQEADFRVSAFPVLHRGPDNFGFLFEEDGRRPFLAEKAVALGIPNGPLRRDLVQGKSITLESGRVIHSEEVLGDFKPGAKLAVVGDVGDTHPLVDFVRGADALVCEATYLLEEDEMATFYGHLTARRAAQLALDAGVKQLILTHVSRRYREKDILDEAQAVFPNTLLARDFDTFQIRPTEG